MDGIVICWIGLVVSFAAMMYVTEFKLKLINLTCVIVNMLVILDHYKLI